MVSDVISASCCLLIALVQGLQKFAQATDKIAEAHTRAELQEENRLLKEQLAGIKETMRDMALQEAETNHLKAMVKVRDRDNILWTFLSIKPTRCSRVFRNPLLPVMSYNSS